MKIISQKLYLIVMISHFFYIYIYIYILSDGGLWHLDAGAESKPRQLQRVADAPGGEPKDPIRKVPVSGADKVQRNVVRI